MEDCKHCGSNYGYYVIAKIKGRGQLCYNFDDTWHDENGHMHDYLEYKENKTMYCINCNKKLGIKNQPQSK